MAHSSLYKGYEAPDPTEVRNVVATYGHREPEKVAEILSEDYPENRIPFTDLVEYVSAYILEG